MSAAIIAPAGVVPVKTPPATLCYPNLFTPRAYVEGTEPKFSCVLVFDPAAQKAPEFIKLREQVKAAIITRWGDQRANDARFMKTLRAPFRSCEEKAGKQGFDVPGGVFISPWSKEPVGIVNARAQDVKDPAKVWAGMVVWAVVKPFAYDTSGNKGVGFYLNNVQLIRKGEERFDGKRSAKADFGEVEGDAYDDDDDVPFFLTPTGRAA